MPGWGEDICDFTQRALTVAGHKDQRVLLIDWLIDVTTIYTGRVPGMEVNTAFLDMNCINDSRLPIYFKLFFSAHRAWQK